MDSNGDPATVTVTSDQGRNEQFTVPVGVSTITTQPMDFGYQQTETITVTLSDAAPGRGPVSGTNSATTEPPPPPTVVRQQGCGVQRRPGARPASRATPAAAARQLYGRLVRLRTSCCTDWRPVDRGTAVFRRVDTVHGGRDLTTRPTRDYATDAYYGDPGGTVTRVLLSGLGQNHATDRSPGDPLTTKDRT